MRVALATPGQIRRAVIGARLAGTGKACKPLLHGPRGGESVCGGRRRNEDTARHPNPMNSFVVFARRLALSLLLLGAAPALAGVSVVDRRRSGRGGGCLQHSGDRQPARRRRDDQDLHHHQAGQGLRRRRHRRVDQDSLRHRPLLRCRHRPAWRRARRDGRREPGHQFGRFRGQQEGQVEHPRPACRLEAARRPDRRRLQSDIQRIKDYYARSGRPGATVEPR